MRVLCSTGVFTRTSDPLSHEAILRYAPQFAVDGFEVIVYPRWYTALEAVSRVLSNSDMVFPVIHIEKGVGEKFGSGDAGMREQGITDFARNCDFARRIGARLAILHLWGLPESDTHLERNLGLLSRCLDIAEQYGLDLAVETIPCVAADPLANIERAYARDSRMCVALDTEFLAMHDQIENVFETAWLWQTRLVKHVHLKDFVVARGAAPERRYLHPGDGQIDFERFMRQLRRANFDGALSLEARGIDGDNNVEVERIATSLQRITNLAHEIE
jgi:sugar phosphate isomerase/epimerase